MESKLFKRVLSLAIVVFMVLSMLPMNVFAVYADAECPHCGEAFTGTWTEVPADTWNAGGDVFADGGHYRLTGKQTLTAELVLAEGKTVCIDLNGYAISAEKATLEDNFRAISNSGTMTVLDSSANGAGFIEGGYLYTKTKSATLSGGTINNTGTFNLYAGTVKNGYLYHDGSDGYGNTYGGNIYNTGIVNQYGGKITGGGVRGFAYTNNTNGANVYCTEGSELNLYGGEISGGNVRRGRWARPENAIKGVNVCSFGDVTIDGGKITGATYSGFTATSNNSQRYNYVYGGNLYIEGAKLTLKSGSITDGQINNNFISMTTSSMTATSYGANVYATGATVEVSGGEISGGIANTTATRSVEGTAAKYAYAYGGNIHLYNSTMTFTGGTIKDGSVLDNNATNELGGNLFVRENSVVTMSGGTISGGTSGYSAGSVYINGTSKMTITGGLVTGGTAEGHAGNFYVDNGGELTVTGGVIENGRASANDHEDGCDGGNIALFGGKLVAGGNAIIRNGATSSTVASSYGGNIYGTSNGQAIFKENVLVEGGSAYAGGNFLFLTGITAEMYGGTLTGGTSSNSQYAIDVDDNYGSSLAVYGGNIDAAITTGGLTIYNGTIKQDPGACLAPCACYEVDADGKYQVWHAGETADGTACTASNCAYKAKTEDVDVDHTPDAADKHEYGEDGICTICGALAYASVTTTEGNVTCYADATTALKAANGTGATVHIMRNATVAMKSNFPSANPLKNVTISTAEGVTLKDSTSASSSNDWYIQGVTFAQGSNVKLSGYIKLTGGSTNNINGNVSAYMIAIEDNSTLNINGNEGGYLKTTGNFFMRTNSTGGHLNVYGTPGSEEVVFYANVSSSYYQIANYSGAIYVEDAVVSIAALCLKNEEDSSKFKPSFTAVNSTVTIRNDHGSTSTTGTNSVNVWADSDGITLENSTLQMPGTLAVAEGEKVTLSADSTVTTTSAGLQNVGVVAAEGVNGCVWHNAETGVYSVSGHTADDATCTEDGKCTNCTAVVNEATGVHTYENMTASGETASAADCDSNRTEYVKCDNCDHVNTELTVEIENTKIEHNYTYTSNGDGTHNGVCANNCGVADNGTCDEDGTDGACSKCGYVAKTYVAEVNGVQYESLADAENAAVDGDTITLLADIELTQYVTFYDKAGARMVTLDMNGKTITLTERGYAALWVCDSLTIIGNGKIIADPAGDAPDEGASAYAIMVGSRGTAGNLVIENGTFYSDDSSVISVTHGSVTIKGGSFESEGKDLTLNCIDDMYDAGKAAIIVEGGEFKGFNPFKNAAEGTNTNFAAPGLHFADMDGDGIYTKHEAAYVAKDFEATFEADAYTVYTCVCGDTYTVTHEGTKKTAVAEVNGTQYESLLEAWQHATANSTIKLLADVDMTGTEGMYVPSSTLTLDLNDFTLKVPYQAIAFAGDNFTICNGTIDSLGASYGLWIGGYADAAVASNVTIEDVTVIGGINIKNATNVTLNNVTATGIGYYAVWVESNASGVVINSGSYTGAEGKAAVSAANADALTVKGGTFSSNVTAYCEEGKHTAPVEGVYVYGEHSYTSVVTDPTCTEDGYTTYTCACGDSYTEAGETATGHTYTYTDNGDKTHTIGCEKGDYSVVADCVDENADNVCDKCEATLANYVAEVNGTKYETLAEAVEAAKNGGTVKLLADVELDSAIVIAKGWNVTIDMAGYNISWTLAETPSANTHLITNKGTLTITDSTGEYGEICLTYTGAKCSYSISTICNMGTLNITGGSVNNVPGAQSIAYAIDNNSTIGNAVVNVSGGWVIGGAADYCIRQYANSTTYANTVNVTDGMTFFIWVQNPDGNANKAAVNVTGGTVYYVYISAVNGVCNVENITLNAKAENVPYGVAMGTMTEDYVLENVDGVYTLVKKNYVAEVGGTKYETLADAENAAVDGDTIILLADIELTQYVTFFDNAGVRKLTLDMNGKTITLTERGYAALWVCDGLTITGNGKIIADPAGEAPDEGISAYAIIVGSRGTAGNLVIENGTFYSDDSSVISVTYGTVTIKGGSFESEGKDLTLNCVDDMYDAGKANIIVEGGEFKGFNPFKNSAEGANTNFVAAGKHATDADGDGIYEIDVHSYTETVVAPDFGVEGYTLHECACGDSYKDTFVAAKVAVAEVNGTKYESLQAAIDAAGNGDTVKLLADVELDSAIVIAKGWTVTIDLAGNTVSREDASGAAAQAIKNEGNLTIDDSIGGGKITFKSTTPSSNNGYSTSTIINAGNLTIDGGMIENTTASGPSYAIDNSWYTQDVSLTVNDGTIVAAAIAVRQVPFSTTYKNVVNINGGTLTGATAGLQVHNYATSATLSQVNVSGGTFNGAWAFYTTFSNAVNSGNTEITISDGTFNGYLFLYNGNTGSAAQENVFKANVTGGTFNGEVYIYAMDAEGGYAYQPAISGGEFATEVYQVMCAEGYIPAYDEETGKYGVIAHTHDYTGTITTNPSTTTEGVKTYTCTCGDSYTETMDVLPQATVTDKGATTYAGSYYIYDVTTGNLTSATGGINLPKTLVFTAQDEGEAATNNYYADFNTDFYVKLDGLSADSVKGTGCYLAGYYAAFDAWVVIPLDNVDIQNGIAYPLLAIAGWDFSYEMICNGVKEFTCGLYLSEEFLAANPDVQVTVDLGLREEQIKDLGELENLEYFESEGFEYDKEDLDAKLVAMVGNVKYYSLAEAIAAAQPGDTVTLLADIELTEGIVIAADDEIVLDLNGKTVSVNDASGATAALLKNNGTLTINDTVGGGKLSFNTTTPSANNGYASNTITNSGNLTINGGIIENTSTGGACYALDNYAGSTATINGGKLTAVKTAVRIFNWTNGEAAKATLNITGGEIVSESGYGINVNAGNAPYVALNISGGTITTNDAVYNLAAYIINKGSAENLTVNVTGGTFNGNFALNGVTSTTMAEDAVSITGGTFEGVTCYGDPAYGFITGGTFYSDVDEYCAVRYAATETSEGVWTIAVNEAIVAWNPTTGVEYESVQAALNAAKAGETVQLLTDVTESFIYVSVNRTLDLNGHTLTAETVSASFTTSYIIDSTDGEGLLKVAKENISLNSGNKYLPIWTDEGARFESFEFKQNLQFEDNGDTAYFRFYVDKDAEDTLVDDYLANGTLTLRIKATWTNANGSSCTQYFEVPAEMIQDMINSIGGWDGNMFTLYLRGVSGIENLSICAEVVSTANTQASVVVSGAPQS